MRPSVHTALRLAAAAFGLWAALSCAKAVPSTGDGDPIPLLFRASATGAVTRALPGVANAPLPVGYDTRERFSVYAIDQDRPFDEMPAAVALGRYYMHDVACSYDAAWRAWAPDTPYYWLPEAAASSLMLTFQAYSPSVAGEDCAGGAVLHGWTDGLRFPGFTPREPGAQYDLLYGDLHKDCRRPGYVPASGAPYDEPLDGDADRLGIDLRFRHALSWLTLRIKAKVDEDAVQGIRLQRVALTGVWDRGDFEQRLSDLAGPRWTIPSSAHEREYVVYENGGEVSDGVRLYEDDDDPDGGYYTLPVQLMVVPQALLHPGADSSDPADDTHVGIEIVYSRTIMTTGRTVLATLRADLAAGNAGGYYSDGTSPVEAWETGMHYTYRLVINLFKIFVDPTVSDWTDYADADVMDGGGVVTDGHGVVGHDTGDPLFDGVWD